MWLFLWLLLLAVFIVLVVGIVKIVKKKQYEKTEYYQQTKKPYLNLQFNKGLSGEFYTYKCLKRLKGYKRYLFNLYLPKDNEETTELDVVLLHESGIYVFESKNYSGQITGIESQSYWTQTLSTRDGRPYTKQFFNPILQNKGHIKWLQAFLADQTLPVYSYIVFGNGCILKDIVVTGEESCVVNLYTLLPAVQENIAKVGMQLSPNQIDTLFQTLYPLTQVNEAEKMNHIKNVEQTKQAMCPHCGGKLIMRISKRGKYPGRKFWGCSNYPNCRYKKDIPDE